MKNKLIILGLIGSVFLMVSCTVNKRLYLKGGAITWNKIKHQSIDEGSNFTDNFIEQKLSNNTNSNEKENFKTPFIGTIKPISNKKSGSKSMLESLFIKPIKNKSVENFNVGDSVEFELFSGKVYFGIISKIEKDGYFIEIKNKREIFISKREIKQFTVIQKAQVKNAEIKLQENEGVVSSNNNKVNNGGSNFKSVALNVLKIIGKIVLTILAVFSLLIIIVIIAIVF
jgi:hypothetical protein